VCRCSAGTRSDFAETSTFIRVFNDALQTDAGALVASDDFHFAPETKALAYILLTLRYMFGLDDEREVRLSQVCVNDMGCIPWCRKLPVVLVNSCTWTGTSSCVRVWHARAATHRQPMLTDTINGFHASAVVNNWCDSKRSSRHNETNLPPADA
jgi:hypothetical protein